MNKVAFMHTGCGGAAGMGPQPVFPSATTLDFVGCTFTRSHSAIGWGGGCYSLWWYPVLSTGAGILADHPSYYGGRYCIPRIPGDNAQIAKIHYLECYLTG